MIILAPLWNRSHQVVIKFLILMDGFVVLLIMQLIPIQI